MRSENQDEVTVSYRGSIIRVIRVNGLYKCPFCESLFYTPGDLFSHILAHAANWLSARREVSSRWS